MRAFRRIGITVFIISVSLAALVFVLENQQPSSLLFLGFSTPVLPISLYITIALLVGMVIGPLSILAARGVFGFNNRARSERTVQNVR